MSVEAVETYKYKSVVNYELLMKIGQGSFGQVFKAREKSSGKIVALKKIVMDQNKIFSIAYLREVQMLSYLKSEHVVDLLEICREDTPGQSGTRSKSSPMSIYLVFEFCQHDLAGILCNGKIIFSMGEIKMILKQLFSAIYYLHFRYILHRDLKTPNVLITSSGIVKLADFGFAKKLNQSGWHEGRTYTQKVVTLWYRPPEILLGDTKYSYPVDLWSAGCIMAEMWTRYPTLQGTSELNQLMLIIKLCGSITPEVWPEVVSLGHYKDISFTRKQTRNVVQSFSHLIKDDKGIALLDKLLSLNPAKRGCAHEILYHPFFRTEPLPCDLKGLMAKCATSKFSFYEYQEFDRTILKKHKLDKVRRAHWKTV